ncbi:MAG: hypothetical protein ACNS62_06085 [Candidatus Cyclobacteriaceae bacterium M3_2C_046]
MPISPDTLRVGKKYRLVNYGHTTEFVVQEVLEENDFRIKDLAILEELNFKDLVKYGKGNDYELEEL